MKKIIAVAGVFLLTIFTAFLFLLYTEKGLQVIVSAADNFSKGKVSVEKAAGKAGTGFTLDGLSYIDDGQNLVIDHIIFSWNPFALLLGEAHIKNIMVDGVRFVDNSPKSVEKKSSNKAFPDVSLPLNITLENLDIKNVVISAGTDSHTEIERVVVAMVGGSDVFTITTMSIKAPDYELKLSGAIGINEGVSESIEGEWSARLQDFPSLNGKCRLSGSLKDGKFVVMMTSPFVSEITTDFVLNKDFSWKTNISIKELETELFHESYPGNIAADILFNGVYGNETVTSDIKVKEIKGNLRDYPVLIKGNARFENDQLDIEELLLKSGASDLLLRGKVSTLLDLIVELNSPDLSEIIPNSTGQISFQTQIMGQRKFPGFKVKAQGSEIAVQGAAIGSLDANVERLDGKDGELDAELHLTNINYAERQIENVDVTISGIPKKHLIDLNVQQKQKNLSASITGGIDQKKWIGAIEELIFAISENDVVHLEKRASLEVGTEHVSLDELCLTHRGGEICVDGELQPEEWQAKVDLKEFDPASFFAEWPGRISGIISGQGRLLSDEKSHLIELQSLAGTLRGKPLLGSGSLSVERDIFNFNDLNLSLGNAYLNVQGTLAEAVDVMIDGSIPDLSELVPDAKGSVALAGSIKGSRKAPSLDLVFSAAQAEIAKFTLEELRGNLQLDLTKEGRVFSEIKLKNLSSTELQIEEGSVDLEGKTDSHGIQISLSTNHGKISLKGKGNYSNSWNGVLTEMSLLTRQYGDWFLDGETAVKIGPLQKSINDFCLTSDGASLCADAYFDSKLNWTIDAEIADFALSKLRDYQVIKNPIQGKLQGAFTVGGQGEHLTDLVAEVSLPQLEIKNTVDEEIYSYEFLKNSIKVNLDEDVLNLVVYSEFPKKSNFLTEIKVSEANNLKSDFKTLPIAGTVALDIKDLSLFSVLTQSVVKPEGRLKGELQIAGLLYNPVIDGDLLLQEGGVEIPILGITIQDLLVSIEAGKDSVDFDYSGTSGPGKLEGKGQFKIDFDGDWWLKTQASGSHFDLVTTQQYTIRVNPDVRYQLNAERSILLGELKIPYARISTVAGDGSVSASDDVIFVDEPENTQQKKMEFITDIAIELGDDVTIDAFGLRSHLVGQLRLKDAPGKVFSALGELVVKNGEFSLYSTEMEINRGRLLFTGGPVENPGVDFRAQRKIDKKLVGVDVGGTVNDLDFQLFSDPMMDESDILAYILVGRSMYRSNDNEQSLIGAAASALGMNEANKVFGKIGDYIPVDEIYLDGGMNSEDMSLVLGKYITDDLFIGYDHNFFDSTGDFKVRYDLGYGFSVETKSSVEATSGDLLYSIER